jgi:hypothetical protein
LLSADSLSSSIKNNSYCYVSRRWQWAQAHHSIFAFIQKSFVILPKLVHPSSFKYILPSHISCWIILTWYCIHIVWIEIIRLECQCFWKHRRKNQVLVVLLGYFSLSFVILEYKGFSLNITPWAPMGPLVLYIVLLHYCPMDTPLCNFIVKMIQAHFLFKDENISNFK